MPTLASSCRREEVLDRRAVSHSLLNFFNAGSFRVAADCLDIGGLETIFQILLLQLIRCRDCNGAQFMKTDDDRPELPVPAKEEHYAVTLLDALCFEVVRSTCAHLLHLKECETTLEFVLI